MTWFSEDAKGNVEPQVARRSHRQDPADVAGLPRGCELWPPNKRMVPVAHGRATDGGSGVASLTAGRPAATWR